MLLLAGTLVGTLLALRRQPEQAVRISNAETVILKKITVGQRHRFSSAIWWQQLLSRLPFAWSARFRSRTVSFDTTNTAAVAWLMWTGVTTQVYAIVPDYVITDEQGKKVYLAGAGTSTRVDNNTVIDIRPVTVPLTGRTIRLGLYRHGSNNEPVCIAEFEIPKPRRRSVAPSLAAKPLPLRAADGDVEITLTELLVEEGVRADRGFAAPLTHVFLRITEAGLPTTNWGLTKLTLVDPAGNRGMYQVASYSTATAEEYWGGGTLLFADEVAWKMDLEFQHRNDPAARARNISFVAKPRVTRERVN